MFKKILISMTIPLAIFANLIEAAPNTLKPVSITPTRIIPAQNIVKEVGGIQYGRHQDITLADGTVVRCYPAATEKPEMISKNWYYLPTSPHISKHPDGTPQFTMVRFVTDKSKKEGGVDGAILHFMAEYGLSDAQKMEAEKKLQKTVKGAMLKGAVPLEVGSEGSSFNVVSATLNDKGFASTLITSGKAPVMEGQKVAVAARLDQYGATLLAKSLENPTTDISVVFDLQYIVKLPAYDVTVSINYDRYNEVQNEYVETREKKTTSKKYWDPKWYNPLKISTKKSTTITESEQQQMIDFLQESGVVTFNYIQHVPDADKEIVESGLHKLVLESFFDMQKRLGTPSDEELTDDGSSEEDKARVDERRKAASGAKNYSYTSFQRKEITRKSTQTLSLKKTIARYEPHQMVGNVGTWYKQYKDNPKLFSEVNLDDPFFQRRELRFMIDNEAYDIFKDMVNYATVQIRVPRKDGAPFMEEATFDRKYIEQNGQTISLSYARMGDDEQTFEYATQWSLRGGQLYPVKPQWQKGEIMAVTLAAPVQPQTIEAETDLTELESLGISRASVELRYKQFGRDYIDKQGLALSPGQGEPLVQKTIYHDRSSNNVQYRVIFHHKTLGKLVTEQWQTVDGGYLYVTLTDILREKIRSVL
ncbi:MAG: hypothetical protein JXA04_00190 [Gammaproteobacteria bacterium]|nr:hypothetical protein [Gammaproteobacteria bacterium]